MNDDFVLKNLGTPSLICEESVEHVCDILLVSKVQSDFKLLHEIFLFLNVTLLVKTYMMILPRN